MVRVNPETEQLASMGEKDAIWESFIPGTEPQGGEQRPVLDGSVTGSAAEGAISAMTPASAVSDGAVVIGGPSSPTAAERENVKVIEGSAPPTSIHPASTSPPAPVPDFKVTPAPVTSSPATMGTGGLY